MTDLQQHILDDYQVRKTQQQKDRFIALLKEYHPDLQIQSGGILKSRNLIIGDPERAEVLLCAHYDTCARMILPNFITPKRPLISVLYSFIMIIPMGIAVFLLNFLISLFTDIFWVHYLFSVAVWLGLMYLMVAGPANPNTVNDNTSGVLMLCKLLDEMNETQKEKTAVIFFDNEELGLVGSSLFRKLYKKTIKNKLVINFDCISDGDYIMVASSKEARKPLEQQIKAAFTCEAPKKILFTNSERVYYPSDQAGFPKHIAIAALKYHKVLGHYMDRIHTVKDTVLDENNFPILCNAVLKLIDSV